jgi:hypothetical protein
MCETLAAIERQLRAAFHLQQEQVRSYRAQRDRDTGHALAAFCAGTLSMEAAEQLVRMSEDDSCPRHEGRDLPPACKATLLKAHQHRVLASILRHLKEHP